MPIYRWTIEVVVDPKGAPPTPPQIVVSVINEQEMTHHVWLRAVYDHVDEQWVDHEGRTLPSGSLQRSAREHAADLLEWLLPCRARWNLTDDIASTVRRYYIARTSRERSDAESQLRERAEGE